jgi:hypothetical protein
MRRDVVIAALLAAVAFAFTHGSWGETTMWHPDALFYEAQLLEIRGAGRDAALHEALDGPLSTGVSGIVHDPRWVAYNRGFYRRRWVVPLLGAAVEPAAGTDSLQLVSLIGYALIGPFAYLLLRRRFAPLVSLAAALVCIALPSLRFWSAQPLVDSFAVALETLALLTAVLVLERGRRWLAPWVLAMLALSFTKDATMVLVVAAFWVAARRRTRRALALLASGVAASVPPALAFGAPLQRSLASIVSGFQVPEHTSWGFVARHYPRAVRGVLDQDFEFLTRRTPVTGLVVLVALVALAVLPRRGDDYFRLVRSAVVGCVLMILVQPNPTGLRLELVFVPVLAVGLAVAFDRALRVALPVAGGRGASPSDV